MLFRVVRTSIVDGSQPHSKAKFDECHRWVINIDNLEELNVFATEHNEKIIIDYKRNPPIIEIYDTWRE